MLASCFRAAFSANSVRFLSTSAVHFDRYDPKLFTDPTVSIDALSEPLELDDPRNFLFIKALKSDQSPVFYRDHVVDKLVRVFMKDGKKEITRSIVLSALEIVKRRQYKAWLRAKTDEEKEQIELDAFAIANKALLNCRPLMKLLGVTRGGTTYKVPFPIPEAEAEFRAMKMMRDICRQKARKGETSSADILATELLAASKNEGLTIQAKQELHKLLKMPLYRDDCASAKMRSSGSTCICARITSIQPTIVIEDKSGSCVLDTFPSDSIAEAKSLVMNIAGTSQDAPTGPTDRIVDLNAAIDVLVEQSRVKKSENELPKIDHMKEVLEGLQFHHFRRIIAAEFSKESKSPRIPQNLWLGKLHKVIFGILHTKHLPAEHTDMCFSIAHGAFQLVGSAWFTEDLRLLPLFAALLTVQLRLLLHTPSEVNEEKLVCCVELMEGLIDLVENHDDVDDLVATHIGAHLHEAIEFSIEFLSVSSDDLPLNAKATLFRIVCCYLSVGGHSLFPKEKLISVKRSLKQILESGDIPTLREMFEPLESALPEA